MREAIVELSAISVEADGRVVLGDPELLQLEQALADTIIAGGANPNCQGTNQPQCTNTGACGGSVNTTCTNTATCDNSTNWTCQNSGGGGRNVD